MTAVTAADYPVLMQSWMARGSRGARGRLLPMSARPGRSWTARAAQGARGRLLPLVALALLVAAGARPALALSYGRPREPVWPRFGAELRATPYRPILSNLRDARALRTQLWDRSDTSLIHGHPLMFGGSFAWYAWDDYGLLGPMLTVGYWHQSGLARKCVDANNEVVQCTPDTVAASQPGTDQAGLLAIPISLGAVYRYDLLRRYFAIPLSLHAKAGLSYTLYWGSLGSQTSTYRQRPARGGTAGWYAAAGATLALSGLGKRDAAPYGLNGRGAPDAGLFVEYTLMRDLPSRTIPLNFGDNTAVTLGLSIDFR